METITIAEYKRLKKCEQLLGKLYRQSSFYCHTIELDQYLKDPIDGEEFEQELELLFGDKDE